MANTRSQQDTKREAVSPINKSHDEYSSNTEPVTNKKPRRHQKYHFAPVNNINQSSKQAASVLKSISVSQLRNTAIKTKPKPDDSSLKPPVKIKMTKARQSPNSTPVKMNISTKRNLERQEGEFIPTQEVVWKYSPSKNHEVSQILSSPEKNSKISLVSSDKHDISSTPIVPSRLKSILDFKHIDDKESTQYSSYNPHKQYSDDLIDDGKKSSLNILRDIDDILDDLGSFNSTKPNFLQKCSVPSSPSERKDILGYPTKIEEKINPILPEETNTYKNENYTEEISISMSKRVKKQEILVATDHKSHTGANITAINGSNNNRVDNRGTNFKPNEVNYPNEEDDEEGEDSLIEMLTQKHLTQNNSVRGSLDIDQRVSEPIHSKITDDDSLLDYLESSDSDSSTSYTNFQKHETLITDQILPDQCSNDLQTLNYMKRAQCAVQREGIVRLVIENIREVQVPKIGRQKILKCINSLGESSSIILRHPWVYLDVEEGDVIHIIEGIHSKNKRLLSDDKDSQTQTANDNLLIVNPDILLSATTIGTSLECLRRAVIQSLFQDTRGIPSKPMLIGNIVHELLQGALQYKLTHSTLDTNTLEENLDQILNKHKFEIITCNTTISELKLQILDEHVENIREFINKFVKNRNGASLIAMPGSRKKIPLSISNIIDIEENIWSPSYGLKGFLDATIEVNVKDQYFITPLEVKTGKSKLNSHEAQGLTYTFLLKDRYDLPIDFFLLLYTRYNDISKYEKVLHSVRHIFMLRNQVANKLKYQLKEIKNKSMKQFEFPPILRGSVCDNCFMKQECMTIDKLLDSGTAETCGLREGEYDQLTGHLSNSSNTYQSFFKKYYDLIMKEESSMLCMNPSFFLIDSKTKENEQGNCISNLSIVKCMNKPDLEDLYIYEFAKGDLNGDLGITFITTLTTNDAVFVSDEEGHFALCQGHVVSVTEKSITISTKRSLLHNKFQDSSSRARAVHSVLLPNTNNSNFLQTQNLVKYRIDRNEIQYGLSQIRYNLLNLFLPSVSTTDLVIDELTGNERTLKASEGGDANTRRLIVDNAVPRFRKKDEPPVLSAKIPSNSEFNEDQLKAIEMVTRAEDYALILGMPGTGKTTLIAEIIRIIIKSGKTVLLTSYTHSAVDNVLLKLKNFDSNIVRLGSRNKIHPEVQKYIPSYEMTSNFEEYSKYVNDISLVGTTCLSIGDIMFSLKSKDFDYVILDEASQVSLPVALGPLRYASKFIMVGDHFQLPPLVINKVAKEGGLDVSPFQMLCESHPESVTYLTYQYRMCEDISKLSNVMVYEGQLKYGTEIVKNQSLTIPNPNAIKSFQQENCDPWLNVVLEPKNKVLFLNYDSCGTILESLDNNNVKNEGEARLTSDCVKALVESGISIKDIGVLSLYRGQIKILQNLLCSEIDKGLEILTADQFQGRDKKCIVISLVRSNNEQKSGTLLKEMRRVNVAMTRARSKLIILGSKSMLKSVQKLDQFFQLLESNKWFHELPANCLDCYNFKVTKMNRGSNKTHIKNISKDSKLIKNKPIIKQFLTE